MTSVAKFTLPLLLLAACGQDPIAPPSSAPGEVAQERQAPSPTQPEQAAVEVERIEVERQNVTDYGDSHADAPQGVKGRILLPNGEQAAGVQVLLMENIMSNPIDVFLKNKAGRTSPPIASALTAEDGSFALGVRKPGQKVDLRIVTDAHPELSKSPISVRSDDWIDVGDLKLKVGLTVQGRVLNAATNAPVADATVWMTSATRAHMMTATPGRERGVAAVTDGAGFFRFTAAHPALYRVVREAEFVSPDTLRLHYTRIVEGYEAGLRAAQGSGDVDRALDPEVTAWALMGMGELIGMRFLLWERDAEGRPPAELDPAVMASMSTLIDNALAPRAEPKKEEPR